MNKLWKYILIGILLISIGIYSLNADRSIFSMELPEVELIPETSEITEILQLPQERDSVPPRDTTTRFPVAKTVPEEYKDVTTQYPIDLKTPQNLQSEFEYDPVTDSYLMRSKIGNVEVATPMSLTHEQYLEYSLRKSMQSFYQKKYEEELLKEEGAEDAFSMFDMQFDLGPAEKIFGPGGVQLQAQGSVNVKMAIERNYTGNPTLTENQRTRTSFDFDPQIQANVKAKVGDKVNFDLNYNTESTFDFDSKKINLAYQGKEDEIIKVLEGGNVSMTTSNSLIRGGSALFGIKTELQFGKLRVGAILSQQESQSQSLSSRQGKQTNPFEIKADAYDENKHFFLGHYFRDHYDESMRDLPYIRSGITIQKIEVWITNTRSNYDEVRNLVAFADLGENKQHISNPGFVGSSNSLEIPSNKTNDLYSKVTNNYPGVRNMSTVNQAFAGTSMEGGRDYEKIENARKLSESYYTLNKQLGYISLRNITLQADEMLAVAYQYTYAGNTYQVGEFATDNSEGATQNLYVKLLKGTTQSPAMPSWHLMMKNVYSLNTSSLQSSGFKLNILYQNDTTGTYLNYLSEGNVKNQLLLRVMNLDRLNAKLDAYPDGYFDFVEGFTVYANEGKIIFPVIEPFGSHLRTKIGDDAIADKYVYQELYDTTLTIAQQMAEKNKFILRGEYVGSSSGGGGTAANCYNLNSFSVTRGSVRVTADGVTLMENTDYVVDYSAGEVCIVNETYFGAKIDIQSENQAGFGMQRKTLMGLDLQYQINPDFIIGGTVMNLKEMPLTAKVNIGEEAVNNTLFGFNINYKTQSQWLTNVFDKLPLLELTAPSQISFSAEYAQLIAGHYKSKYGGDYSYIDDFERAKVSINVHDPYSWVLSGTPRDARGDDNSVLFPEAERSNDISYGKNRALLAWYNISPIFTRPRSSLMPSHLKGDKIQLSNPYVREFKEIELFPSRRYENNESTSLSVLNLAYYPQERGPYNLDDENISVTGGKLQLKNPEKRWGGIMRRIPQSYINFESNNIEYIEFWLMDPFFFNQNSEGGDLYFNLGDISEDVLKDEKKFFENGLPINGDSSAVEYTVWGKVPKNQSITYAFDNQAGSRALQDVGLNGLSTEEEQTGNNVYAAYMNRIRNLFPAEVQNMAADQFSPLNDPAGDNYHYFRGSDYDEQQLSILERYKKYNGTEGNSVESEQSPENYDTSARNVPDVEDINQDNTMNENERYYQYKIRLSPHGDEMQVGKNFIVDKKEVTITLETESGQETKPITWYQYKIPIRESSSYKNIGRISDFSSIRFMRMFLHNFSDSVILRFGTLELVKGDWRVYEQELNIPGTSPNPNTALSVSAVNLEENGVSRKPVSYVIPPGVSRAYEIGQSQLLQQNEQSLSIKVSDLAPGDARAVYKGTGLDTRLYRRLQMFVHAEQLTDDLTNLQDDDLSVFMRLGTDYKNNYYEYEIPLKITPHGEYRGDSDAEIVWPTENMFDFPFSVFTNLKLDRNREKRRGNASYNNLYSKSDPEKPANKISIIGNPSFSDIKSVMIGIRNNSREIKSTEIWVNELRLTDFNEDGGWAGNANLNVAVSDLGVVNFSGRKETSGFGGLEDGIMERNLDDQYEYTIATNIQLGKFFPEKAKVSLPLYYSYSKQVVSPKYDPLNEDILLEEALDAVETKAEKDSIKNYAQEKIVTRSINLTNVKVDIRSKTPMPYDPGNFSFGYAFSESKKQDIGTEYDRSTTTRLVADYNYAPMIKPFTPFKNLGGGGENTSSNMPAATQKKSAGLRFLNELSFNYLPNSIGFNSEITRSYNEVQLRDIENIGGINPIDASFQEEFYWNRNSNIQWNLTPNLNLSLTTGTQARIDAPHVQVNKQIRPDEYEIWKDSVKQSIMDMGTPLAYAQSFNATYNVPLKYIPLLDWINAALTYTANYNWDKGAYISDSVDLGNTIRNERTIGINNVGMNFVGLYNKSGFLKEVNQKFVMKKPPQTRATGNRQQARAAEEARKKKEEEEAKKRKEELAKRKKKFEGQIKLNPDSATLVAHQLDNKRLRITARGADGRLYKLKFKAIDENSIEITTKDTADLRLVISQLPKREETTWYKVAQVAARGLMSVRTAGFSYTKTDRLTITGFKPNVGDFFGQGKSSYGYAPGVDFAFGFTDKSYTDRAKDRDWLLINPEENITPAIYNRTENFSFRAALEPFVGLKIDLTANRINTKSEDYYYMESGGRKQLGGTFTMTTVALKSAFKGSNAKDNYNSETFNTFLENRRIIASRLEKKYETIRYPGASIPVIEKVPLNSPDVLIPAFLAAYTGKDARKSKITAFPSLRDLLPNWNATYEGLIQLDFINRHFKSFVLSHRYTCTYTVGSYQSYVGWVEGLGDNAGEFGFVEREDNEGVFAPSSPYDIPNVNIIEAFNPLIGLNAMFKSNMTMKLEYRRNRNLQLNIPAYQIIETSGTDFVVGLGYKLTEFNRVLKMRSTGGNNFSNDLTIAADVSFKKAQSLIRKLEEMLNQATSGDSQTTLKLSAKYNMSRALTLEAFFDKRITKPLVSSTAYPTSQSSFGINLNISLSR